MKKRILYSILFSAGCLFVFMGSSGGPGAIQGQDRTGSPLASGFCGNSGCHNAGSFSPEIIIKLEDENSEEIAEYIPGTTYTVKVKIEADGSPSGYGFQSVALDTNNANAGSFGMAGSGMQITTLDNRDYVEHAQRDMDGEFEIEWTAPASGTGPVTFYAAGNAVNGNFQGSGDGSDTTKLQLQEAQLSGLFDPAYVSYNLQLSPNPVQNRVAIRWENNETLADNIRILNAAGQVVYFNNLDRNQSFIEVALHDQPSGLFLVQMSSAKGVQTKKLLKL